MTYTQVLFIIGIVSSSHTDFHSEKIGSLMTPPVSGRVNLCFSFSLSLFSFRSDSIELDFKEISYLVYIPIESSDELNETFGKSSICFVLNYAVSLLSC